MAIANQNLGGLFGKCAPSIRTNIGQCGTVTLCANTVPETISDLETIYESDGEYRLLEHLFMSHFEIKACGAVQHSMRDFFIANARITSKDDLRFEVNNPGLTRIAPFVMAEQKKPINNVFWRLSNMSQSGNNLVGRAYSGSNIPADVRSFPSGVNIYLTTQSAGGAKVLSQYTVSSDTPPVLAADGSYVTLTLEPQMTGTLYSTTDTAVAAIVAAMSGNVGILRRGVINVGTVESYCEDMPAYRNDTLVPFWIQHTRWTACDSQLYRDWVKLVMNNNPLYKNRIYISETERMKQKGEDFENRLFNAFWYGQPISDKQNLYEYPQLPDITIMSADSGLGVEGGKCWGKKANAIGILTQLRECNRWYDAQGAKLNLPALFDAIYNIRRVRAGVGSAAQNSIDLFTDGVTAGLIDRGFIEYYGLIFGDKDRYQMVDQCRCNGENKAYGLQFTSYKLRDRNQGVTLNVITDWAFDDEQAEFAAVDMASLGRMIMILDLTSMYMKVLESRKISNHTGDLKNLVAVDPSFLCVEETMTRDESINGLTWANVLECPQSSLVIDNLSDEIPESDPAAARPNYDQTIPGPYEGGISPYQP